MVLILILVLILVLLLVLVLVLLLFHQLVTGIDVVLLGFQVPGIAPQALLEHVHGRLPVLLADGHVAPVVVIIGRKRHVAGGELHGVQLLGGLVQVLLAVQVVGQIVVRRHGSGVQHQPLAVADIGLGIFTLLELPVALPQFRLLAESRSCAGQRQDHAQ